MDMTEIEDLKLYDIHELEEIFGVDRHVIYKYRESGLLKARKVNKSWRSSGMEIRDFYRVTAGRDISNYTKMVILANQIKNAAAVQERTAVTR